MMATRSRNSTISALVTAPLVGDPAEYRDARVLVELGEDEDSEAEIRCDFEPEQVMVDPDYRVLQLERKKATVKL